MKAISIQFFVPAGQPIIWRGPLVGGAITQFLRDVDWGELDYLVIDLPPGTSDAQLTLAQAVPVSGAVLVTTPQEVGLLDVEKALAMFKRMSVPVLGLVENMTAFICPHCGEATEIFGRGGGERFAAQNQLEYLGGVPLDITVRQGGDVGVPAVAQREPGPAAQALTGVARTIAARMSVRAAAATAGQPAPDDLLGTTSTSPVARRGPCPAAAAAATPRPTRGGPRRRCRDLPGSTSTTIPVTPGSTGDARCGAEVADDLAPLRPVVDQEALATPERATWSMASGVSRWPRRASSVAPSSSVASRISSSAPRARSMTISDGPMSPA